ncbi:hypothetical protein G5B00_08200 [Parapedobacter sp. SGR-10]|uniref:hypothetical protein n=1 Tax=Parapedobacter sp. SGR-10 TaxID=2710879 RepID=UPI0013D72FE2|nr:hypothetical protein [Parapedobacter sp. SGR-10]NGF56497.1 hypothetical protein [Parapedobacter sp. SGR-10]
MALKEIIKNRIVENETADLKSLKEMYAVHAGATDLDEESSLGHEDFAKQDESRESARSLQGRINRAQNLLDAFLQLDFGPKSSVEAGALVLTDSLNFFVGIASAAFEHEGKSYIGLNTDAPIYEVLRGAKAGDEVVFNEQKYKIAEIL